MEYSNLLSLNAKRSNDIFWNYERGNYDLLQNTALLVDWDSLQDNNVDTYSENITYTILSIAKECIPNRQITFRPLEPHWITTEIKRNIRKRKRPYQKAKLTGLEIDWQKCKKVRNSVVSTVRKCKKAFYDKLALKI